MRTMISIETISLCESFAKVFALIPTVLAKTVFFIPLSISNLNSLLYDTSMRFLPTQFPFLPVIRDISDIFFFYLIIKVRVVKKKICICKHLSFFISISFLLNACIHLCAYFIAPSCFFGKCRSHHSGKASSADCGRSVQMTVPASWMVWALPQVSGRGRIYCQNSQSQRLSAGSFRDHSVQEVPTPHWRQSVPAGSPRLLR